MGYAVEKFLFLDIETTGFNSKAEVLEIAAVLVDAKFCVINSFAATVGGFSHPASKIWDVEAFEMHAKNGLLVEILKGPAYPTIGTALQAFGNWILGWTKDENERSVVLAGSSVHTDVAILKRVDQDSSLIPWERLSHRHLDLSTLRILKDTTGWASSVEAKSSPKDSKHRAMSDVMADIEEASRFFEFAKTGVR